MEEQKEHKRRVRYKGTHPRNYNEKYKELNPEKYQGTIEHVIQKGSTPAGMHIPILVDEILDFLKIEPGQNGLDATLGYGGHSSRMLACLQGKGHLCALDVDPIEMAKTKERLAAQGYGPEILTILHQNFANIDQVAPKRLEDLTLFWQISAFPPCRLIIRSAAFPTNMMDRWIFA